jgi:Ca2+-binding RTX toxin-like protein
VDAALNGAFPPDGLNGTSFSGPVVTGVVALMLQANPGLGWRDVQNILAATATHTGSAIGAVTLGTNENSFWFINDAADWNGGGMHFSNDYGYGAVNAYNAVRMAEVWSLFGSAQTTANEHNWWTSKWAGGNVNTGIAIGDLTSTQDFVNLTTTPFAMRVEHVDVTIDFVHQDFTDLRIFLVSPEGTEVQLYDGTGGSDTTSDSEIKWTFGVDALRGELTSGDWHLRIDDVDGGNSGQLYWFEVKVYGEGTTTDASARDDTYHYTDEFLAIAGLAGQGGRTTLSDGGGTDWIDAAAVTGNFALNLAAGAASTVNGTAWFTIAGGTTIENAVTGDGNDSLTGNSGANTLYGMRGNDMLDGGAGADQMHGGKGSDTYVVDDSGDVADETGGNGTDLVQSSVSFSLADAVRAKGVIENLTLLGAAASANGNDHDNLITGNSAANILDGQGGVDNLNGGDGSDTYLVDTTTDVVSEAAGAAAGTADAIVFTGLAGRTLTMAANIERLTLAGAAATNGTGNALANAMTGNGAANILKGGLGNDTLTGNSGADRLYGGAGRDSLTGGAGKDIFFFDTALNKTSNVDRIVGFSHTDDTIRLENAVFKGLHAGVLKAAAFWIGKAAHDADDRIVYNKATGALSFDSDGSGHHAAIQFATLSNRPANLAANDFVVI